MGKRLIALLAGVMAIAIVAAGCGSSSDDSTGEDSTEVVVLTKQEFIEQGDAICAKGSKSLSQEAEDFADENDIDTGSPGKEQQEEVIEAVVGPALQTQADELSKLEAPDGEEDKVAAIIDALETGAEELEDDPASLLEGKGNPLDEASKLADEFGFKECGQP